jgi:hypothetical protein
VRTSISTAAVPLKHASAQFRMRSLALFPSFTLFVTLAAAAVVVSSSSSSPPRALASGWAF